MKRICILVCGVIILFGHYGISETHQESPDVIRVSTEPPEQKATKSGYKFVRINEVELTKLGIKDTKAMGDSWQDEAGVIWGDVAKKDGKIAFMTYRDAREYCGAIGARLPIYQDHGSHTEPPNNKTPDLNRLAIYMGSAQPFTGPTELKNLDGYSPEILPNLVLPAATNTVYNIWGSYKETPVDGVLWSGKLGHAVGHEYIHNPRSVNPVRCVVGGYALIQLGKEKAQSLVKNSEKGNFSFFKHSYCHSYPDGKGISQKGLDYCHKWATASNNLSYYKYSNGNEILRQQYVSAFESECTGLITNICRK